jgi:hypothetical protein
MKKIDVEGAVATGKLPAMGPPKEEKVEKKATEESLKAENKDPKVWGLLNSSAAIHHDIRTLARKMDIEPPSMDDIKKNMLAPPAEDAEKDADEAIMKLTKEVSAIGGNSGKKNAGHAMSDEDAACYASRYTDLGKETAKKHYTTVGNN